MNLRRNNAGSVRIYVHAEVLDAWFAWTEGRGRPESIQREGGGGEREAERETETDRQTDRNREKQNDAQRERETETERKKQ